MTYLLLVGEGQAALLKRQTLFLPSSAATLRKASSMTLRLRNDSFTTLRCHYYLHQPLRTSTHLIYPYLLRLCQRTHQRLKRLHRLKKRTGQSSQYLKHQKPRNQPNPPAVPQSRLQNAEAGSSKPDSVVKSPDHSILAHWHHRSTRLLQHLDQISKSLCRILLDRLARQVQQCLKR